MARPMKKGIDYFPFDVGFFEDKPIKVLKGKYGADGIAVYLYILCAAYKENGYYLELDDDFECIAASDLMMSSEKIGQIINFLCERSLLIDNKLFVSDKIITSRGIQVRFQEAVRKRATKTAVTVEQKYWVLKKEETLPFIKVTQNLSYSEKNDSYSEKNDSYSEKNPPKSKIKKNKIKLLKRKEDVPGAYARVISLLENTVGTLSERACEEVSMWIDECDVSVIEYAIEQAAAYNKRSYGYIRTIVNRCIAERRTTRADCENAPKARTDTSQYKMDDMAAIERKQRLEKMRKEQHK